MKKERIKIPFIILGSISIFIIYFVACISECVYIKIQKSKASSFNIENSSYDYSFYTCLVKLLEKLNETCFYVGIFYFSDAIKTLINSEYEFCTFFVLARWVLRLPSCLIQKYLIDSSFGFNKLQFNHFLQKQIIEQIIILLCLYISVYLYYFILARFSHVQGLPAKNNFELSSSSDDGNKLPPLQMNDSSPNGWTVIFFLFIVFSSLILSFSVFRVVFIDKKELIDPEGKVSAVISNFSSKNEMDFDAKIVLMKKKDLHLKIGFYSEISRKIIISDTAEEYLSINHMSAIMASQFYRSNSQESSFVLLVYFLELFLYPLVVKYVITHHGFEEMKANDVITGVVPKCLVYFYCLSFCCKLARNSIHKKFIRNGDVFAVRLGADIGNAIFQVALRNKNAVMDTLLYSTFVLEEPSLKSRMNRINYENMSSFVK